MSDLFHDNVPHKFILRVWRVMQDTPRHTYQILTKRPERMAEILNGREFHVLSNVWLGTWRTTACSIGWSCRHPFRVV
jgi:protein gp37